MLAVHDGQYVFIGLDDSHDELGFSFGTAEAAIAWLREPGQDLRHGRRLFRVRVSQVMEQRLIAPAAYLEDVTELSQIRGN